MSAASFRDHASSCHSGRQLPIQNSFWQPSQSLGCSNWKRLHRVGAIHSSGRKRWRLANITLCHQQQTGVLSESDVSFLKRAALVSDSSAGLTQPHPNAACVLVNQQGRVVAETYQRAQGTESPESQAVSTASGSTEGCTAYLNLESGDCHGEDAAVKSLVAGHVSRVVVGLQHPLAHLRGQAIRGLRQQGIQVDVLCEAPCTADAYLEQEAFETCARANEALLHRAATRKPLGILKYAMTLDGKIATTSGHSSWVSCPASRQIVFETRARSDAVIVGGQTVRRDNPQLTTRRENGHMPARVVMSRTLDLPEDAKLWDVINAPTIVMTQRGVRRHFQQYLRSKGVEVVEFDFLTPEAVSGYCYDRGYLQCLWECGGTLAAPAISGGAIHKIMAFVAPKVVGGLRAPTPVGELGFVEMTQAVQLVETQWRQVGQDLLLTGYLPSWGGLHECEAKVSGDVEMSLAGLSPSASVAANLSGDAVNGSRTARRRSSARPPVSVEFYKAWDQWGALSNFSPHSVEMTDGPCCPTINGHALGPKRVFPTVEHYYQAQKVAGVDNPAAQEAFQSIATAPSPEEAARIGRGIERNHPHLVRPNWASVKVDVMRAALREKFSRHAGPRSMLIASGSGENTNSILVESSPHDFFWGRGWDGSGQNTLGKLLMEIREDVMNPGKSGQKMAVAAC